jgi:lipoate-protein ligase A
VAQLKVQLDGGRPGAWNMARDAELLAAHRPQDDPVLRVYRWEPAAVTIGYNQDMADFDQVAITARGYDLVRRPTGGRAILHADELTYAVVGTSPSELFGDSLHSTYMRINKALLLFLKELGLDADISDGESRENARGLVCFRSAGKHELKVGGRKLVGSAQRRAGGVFLQHGSILAGPRHLELPDLLGGAGAAAEDALELAAVTTDLSQLLPAAQTPSVLDAHAVRLAACFGTVFGLETVLADRRGERPTV